MKTFPSIFNDVIGPVMRGPSSSHCAAALRIGRMARDLMNSDINQISVKYDPKGSLATTHESQGSDMGLYGGILGFDTDDERLLHYKKEIKAAGIKVNVAYETIFIEHPNTYRIQLKNDKFSSEIIALSTGGGIIEVIFIDGARVSLKGDCYETLFYVEDEDNKLFTRLEEELNPDFISFNHGDKYFIEIKTSAPLPAKSLAKFKTNKNIIRIAQISPVLPVLAGVSGKSPFASVDGMLAYNKKKNLELWELALEYETARGSITKDECLKSMRSIVKIMRSSVENGMNGTEYQDRILPAQSPRFKKLLESNKLIGGNDLSNLIVLYTSAIMETKSSMGVIVAAPTAGSCGSVAGPVLAAGDFLKADDDKIVKAMLTAGLIGVFIAGDSTFAAEEAGCQAECGSGSGMAAAAIAYLGGGKVEHCLSAASLALQNSFGMTCDPVAGRVEAPCIGKNVMAGVNALTCANMALAGYKHLIPLDEVIEAFDKTGKSLPRELRCTALGGLSVTLRSKEIEKSLSKNK